MCDRRKPNGGCIRSAALSTHLVVAHEAEHLAQHLPHVHPGVVTPAVNLEHLRVTNGDGGGQEARQLWAGDWGMCRSAGFTS
jgi:hypothetical protein